MPRQLNLVCQLQQEPPDSLLSLGPFPFLFTFFGRRLLVLMDRWLFVANVAQAAVEAATSSSSSWPGHRLAGYWLPACHGARTFCQCGHILSHFSAPLLAACRNFSCGSKVFLSGMCHEKMFSYEGVTYRYTCIYRYIYILYIYWYMWHACILMWHESMPVQVRQQRRQAGAD